jgi:alpha-tubulin suppressor-like RCC1 family protein
VLTPSTSKPFEVLPLSKIQDMLCGYEHGLFISYDNTFYFLGSNLYNQAAKADTNIQRYYEMVALNEYKKQIRKVSAGGWHNIVVLHSNKLVAWGYNLGNNRVVNTNSIDSRCGADKLHRTHIEQPTIVPLDFDVLDASAGQWHTIALSTKGEVC